MLRELSRNESLKMIFVVRTDLTLSKGEIGQLVGKCVLEMYEKAVNNKVKFLENWKRFGEAKVVVKVKGEKELFDIYETACNKNTNSVFLVDKLGKMKNEEVIIVGIGPTKNKILDEITGHLKLL